MWLYTCENNKNWSQSTHKVSVSESTTKSWESRVKFFHHRLRDTVTERALLWTTGNPRELSVSLRIIEDFMVISIVGIHKSCFLGWYQFLSLSFIYFKTVKNNFLLWFEFEDICNREETSLLKGSKRETEEWRKAGGKGQSRRRNHASRREGHSEVKDLLVEGNLVSAFLTEKWWRVSLGV